MNVVVCVSGGGTNLQALIDGCESGFLEGISISCVISNNASAYALERAKRAGIDTLVISPADYPSRKDFDAAFSGKMRALVPDIVVLAGFLVKIPEEMVNDFPMRIINYTSTTY